MDISLYDQPHFTSMAFHPQKAEKGAGSLKPKPIDGEVGVPVGDGGGEGKAGESSGRSMGYRTYPHPKDPNAPLLVYFHGNAEIAVYSDDSAKYFHSIGMSLIAFDFAGYGWSQGAPLLTRVAPDSDGIPAALPGICKDAGISPSAFILYGRSLGSVCAIHLAAKCPEVFGGLVLECPIAKLTDLPMVRQLGAMLGPMGAMIDLLPDLFRNTDKIASSKTPLLIIHGRVDMIAPFTEGEKLYRASGAPDDKKRMLALKRAGHNDIMVHYGDKFWDWLTEFMTKVEPVKKAGDADKGEPKGESGSTDDAAGGGGGGGAAL